MNSDQVLDDEIVMEEIESAIKRIKRGKRAGRDNICAEHLLYRCDLLKVWLKQVFNTIIFLQTAYQRGVSCGYAIFATQEAALKVLRDGGKAFLSLYDLEKAFDTLEKASDNAVCQVNQGRSLTFRC